MSKGPARVALLKILLFWKWLGCPLNKQWMTEKYKVQLLTSNDEVRNTMFTNKSEIVIGSSLHTDIRLQQPSVEDSHVQIYLSHMRVRVLGNNVFLNEDLLDRGAVYPFQLGDTLRINKHKFLFSLTEPNDFIAEDKVIRRPTMELDHLSIGKNRRDSDDEHEKDASFKRIKLSSEGVEEDLTEAEERSVVTAALNKIRSVRSPVNLSENGVGTSVIKDAIEEEKEVLKREIRESIDHPVVDTPVIPSINKRSLRDLGEAVIENEILKTAEKVVEEKIKNEHETMENRLDDLKQNVKDNIKEELRCDLRQDFMEDVRGDIRDEVKDALTENTFKEAIVADVMNLIETKKEDEGNGDSFVEEAKEKKPKATRKNSAARRRASSTGTPKDPLEEDDNEKGALNENDGDGSDKTGPVKTKSNEEDKKVLKRKAAVSSGKPDAKEMDRVVRSTSISTPQPLATKKRPTKK